jgi:hypothetical protein
MLVLEDSGEERLYFAKELPRDWVGSGIEIRIEQAPTRRGRVSFRLIAKPASRTVVSSVELAHAGSLGELHMKLRMPRQHAVQSATVNGRTPPLGPHGDTVIFQAGSERHFEVVWGT